MNSLSLDDRIVVTGLGICCSIGKSVKEFYDALRQSRKGFYTITEFNTDGCRNTKVGKIDDIIEEESRSGLRVSLFANYAARQAIDGAGLLNANIAKNRIGVSIGTSIGNVGGYVDWLQARENGDGRLRFEATSFKTRINPYNKLKGTEPILNLPPSLIPCEIAQKYGFRAGIASCVTACSAGANSIALAMDFMRNFQADAMLNETASR